MASRPKHVVQQHWAKDEDHPKCCGCEAAFTMFNRRHHCRRCGFIFCNTCAPFTALVPDGGGASATSERICGLCKDASVVESGGGKSSARKPLYLPWGAKKTRSAPPATSCGPPSSAPPPLRGGAGVHGKASSTGSAAPSRAAAEGEAPPPPRRKTRTSTTSLVGLGQPPRRSSAESCTSKGSPAPGHRRVCNGSKWMSDADARVCCNPKCGATFSMTTRRHHCRRCGKIFCKMCTQATIALPQLGHDMPVRVCDPCLYVESRAMARRYGRRVCCFACALCCFGYCCPAVTRRIISEESLASKAAGNSRMLCCLFFMHNRREKRRAEKKQQKLEERKAAHV